MYYDVCRIPTCVAHYGYMSDTTIHPSYTVPVLLGTAREGRYSAHVAAYVQCIANDFGFISDIIDVRDFRLAATDDTGSPPQAKLWARIIKHADGLIIVSPEYNHSYPGELKMMLDMLFDEYENLPVAICGVSKGPLGGARMLELLKLLCLTFRMRTEGTEVRFPNVRTLFSEDGAITDNAYHKRVVRLFDSLSLAMKKRRLHGIMNP